MMYELKNTIMAHKAFLLSERTDFCFSSPGGTTVNMYFVVWRVYADTQLCHTTGVYPGLILGVYKWVKLDAACTLPDIAGFWGFLSNKKTLIFVKIFIKLEIYHSSTISDYTTNNFYSLRHFNRHRRPSSGTECSVVTARTFSS